MNKKVKNYKIFNKEGGAYNIVPSCGYIILNKLLC